MTDAASQVQSKEVFGKDLQRMADGRDAAGGGLAVAAAPLPWPDGSPLDMGVA
ncbi:MAG: hypothetical protein AB1768_00925 [Pseudomonadota bacterium]